MGKTDISDQFRKIGYDLTVMRRSACLMSNPITVDNQSKAFHYSWLGPELFRLLLGPLGFN